MEQQRSRQKVKKRKKKRIWLRILIVLLVLIGAAGIYAFSIYRNLASTVDNIHHDPGADSPRDQAVNLQNGDPFSVLLLGIDDEGGGNGRSDSIIVVTVNQRESSAKMLSIPRDTRTELPGRGLDKINHAFAFGGARMSIETVQNFLDIPIDFYASINMNGLQELVDVVGGVEVDNTMAFSQDGHNFPVGRIRLNGAEALSFTRMRMQDPDGDFGRQGRQRQVIEGIVRQMASFGTVTRFNDILDAVEGNMTTNMTFNEMTTIAMNYNNALNNVEQLQLRGSGQMISGICYQVISDEELSEMKAILQSHLELE